MVQNTLATFSTYQMQNLKTNHDLVARAFPRFPAASRAFGSFVVFHFELSVVALWSISLLLIDHYDNFKTGFTTLNRKAL